MYQSKLKGTTTDRLYQAILTLQTIEECYQFFDDLCTIKEIESMTQRLEVAEWLNEGKTFQEIEAKTGASSATIARVNRSLIYGADGYHLILNRLAE